MASTLTFLKFNNYYNRTLKNWNNTTVSAFTGSYAYKQYTGLNFDIKDGVNTFHFINDSTLDNFDYDYLLVSDDNSNTVKSKWFVKEAIWNRKRQWQLVLRRDLLADFWNNYYQMPFYCRKGLPGSDTDVLAYNSEPQNYNQILKSRIALKQNSLQDSRYIIGFVDKKWGGGDVEMTDYAAIYGSWDQLPEGVRAAYNNDEYYEGKYAFVTYNFVSAPNPGNDDPASGQIIQLRVPLIEMPTYLQNPCKADVIGTGASTIGAAGLTTTQAEQYGQNAANATGQNDIKGFATKIKQSLDRFNYYDKEAVAWFEKYNGKSVLIGETLYQVYYQTDNLTDDFILSDNALSESDKNALANRMKNTNNSVWYSNAAPLAAQTAITNSGIRVMKHAVTFTPGSVNKVTVSAPDSTVLVGMPYNIFVINDTPIARKFISFFAAQYGATFLYDVQLFPYKPDTDDAQDHEAATLPGGQKVRWATSDSKHDVCYHNWAASPYASMVDKKIGANMHMCRMISPNGSSSWEFNPAAIGGIASDSFNYEFTLIPFNSYLHIFPKFGGLYGDENKNYSSHPELGETRGLICAGPWSFPYSSDNWKTYQLNNSAYMNSFERTIENMTTMQNLDRTRETINIEMGALQSAAIGGAAGLTLGAKAGPIGAVTGAFAGAFIGGGVAGEMGLLDQELNEAARQELKNYTVAQFYNNLQNIKAQSRPLQHNSSITIGNSYYPIIEFYSADLGTDTTMKDYFKEDLRVHGWTMGVKTTVNQMLTNMSRYNDSTHTHLELAPTRYIQGDLLNVTTVTYSDDAHIANEIAIELNKGVYLWQI